MSSKNGVICSPKSIRCDEEINLFFNHRSERFE